MKLHNDFTPATRTLYLYARSCFLCGANGWNRGGLEIHHVLGRISRSPFNSSLLCGECHGHMGHSREEHQGLFVKTLEFLYSVRYVPTEDDLDFLRRNWDDLFSERALQFIEKIVGINYRGTVGDAVYTDKTLRWLQTLRN